MHEFWLVFKGLMAGLAIAVPVGPVNVLCASRTLARGRTAGLLSGLGAATADGCYGAIAAFSISFVIDFLKREEFWFRVIGGLLLIGIGLIYFRKPPHPFDPKAPEKSSHSDYISALFLTLTNPTTVLSFLAVLAGIGMTNLISWWMPLLVVGGIFSGSMLWWVILVFIIDRLRDRFDARAIGTMNRVAGIAIGAFGFLTLILGLTHPR